MTAAAQATAVIAAAGAGERLGAGGPKALVEVAGRPLVAWSLDAFGAAASVNTIVVAAPPGSEEAFEALAPPGHPFRVVAGGSTRAESVRAATALARTDLVAIHDAARPLVTPDLVDGLVERLVASPDAAGVIAATPVTDTVKRAGAPRPAEGSEVVTGTEDRDLLWAAQTPQVFRVSALLDGLDRAGAFAVTDEAMLIEAAGGQVLLHAAPVTNLKVTTPADLRVAELLLAAR